MVMGSPYSYEKVLKDSNKYPKADANGFIAWWETYLIDEGFRLDCWQWSDSDLHSFSRAIAQLREEAVGYLTMNIPHKEKRHIVAVDRMGIIDPADDAPPHESVERYIVSRRLQGAVFDDQRFVTVTRLKKSRLVGRNWRSAIANAINRIIT